MLDRFSERHPLLWAYLFFLYFSLPYQLLILASGMSGTVGVRQAVLVSALWLIPIVLFPYRTKIIAAISGILLWLAGLVAVGYFLIYRQDFSQSVIFIFFESNISEGMEFAQSYLKPEYLLIFALFSLMPIYLWRKMRPPELRTRQRLGFAVALTLISAWPFLGYLLKGYSVEEARYHQIVRMEPAAPWNLVFGFVKYQQQLKAMNTLLANNSKLPPLAGLIENHADEAKTFVLVIGESTNSKRMGIYGYERDTTPRLSAIESELFVFDNVITSRPYTIEALQQVLSFADQQNPERFFTEPTLVNAMQQAGYEVTWITNQQTQTKRNTMLTTLSQLADKQVYLNNNRAQNSEIHDGVVLEPLAEALASDAKHKMIVVHLLGTHRKYDYRYPDEFDHFSNADGVPLWVDSGSVEEYNCYDNAIRYNDFVLAEIIALLKKEATPSAMAYLSDHGEEVYDTEAYPFSGRNEDAPLPAMYTVPLVIWKNAQYDKMSSSQNWSKYTNRALQSSDFIYLWFDMVGLSFDGMDPSRSAISESFVSQPRMIGNPRSSKALTDYDKLFPTKPILAASAH